MWLLQYLFLFLLICFGCEKYYVSIKRDGVDRSKLASTFVGSPDPRQQNPSQGEALIIEWSLPSHLLQQSLTLQLKIIYHDYSEKTLCYPVDRRRGLVVYSLLDDEYYKTGGFLTYMAEIRGSDGLVLQEWKEHLWVELIPLDDIDVHKRV